jgi:N-acetylmuramoyl-L-alanine amidase
VVAESDTANHAGYSVWADNEWFYVGLNESFLGVSFDAQSQPGKTEGIVSPAQVRAAAMLTEMLRGRYRIPAENCVTHAQVSVNPSNMLVGYHTDWAAGFPFAELGLPDNYQQALPSLWAFGFQCEPAWLASSGNRISAGVKLAEQDIMRGAAAAGIRPAAYRKGLRERYKAWLAESRASPPIAQLSSLPAPPAGSYFPGARAAPLRLHPAARKRTRPYAHAEK